MAGGGNKVELGEASLKRLAMMFGENSARTAARQPVQRKPFNDGNHGSHDASRKADYEAAAKIESDMHKAAELHEKQIVKLKKQQRDTAQQEAALEKKAREAEEKLLEHQKESDSLQKKILEARKKAAHASADADKKAARAAAERLKAEYKTRLEKSKAAREEAKSSREQLKNTKAERAERSKAIREKISASKAFGSSQHRTPSRPSLPPLRRFGRGLGQKFGEVDWRGHAGGASRAIGGTIAEAAHGLGPTAGGMAQGIGGLASGLAGANPYTAIAGAAWDAAKAVAKAAVSTDDKLLKMAGNWTKYTGTIKSSDAEAEESLLGLEKQFKDVYVDTTKQTADMGFSDEERIARIESMSKAFRPITEQGELASKTLTDIVSDSLKFQTAFNQTGESISSAMTDGFRKFGKSGPEVSEQMAAMYNSFQTGNEIFKKELGANIIRMDEFSDITFQSAHRADLWTSKFGEVADKLTVIAKLTTQASMAEERRQKIAKGIINFEQSDSESQIGWLASKKAGADYSKMNEKDVMKRDDLDAGAKSQIANHIKKNKNHGFKSQAHFGQMVLDALNGSAEGGQRKREALQGILDKVPDAYGKAVVAQKFMGGDISKNEALTNVETYLARGGDYDKSLQVLRDAKGNKKGAGTERQAMGKVTGGAAKTQFAASGIIDSAKNMTESLFEAGKAAKLAGNAFEKITDVVDAFAEAMAKASGDKDLAEEYSTKRGKRSTDFKKINKNLKDAADKHGMTPQDLVEANNVMSSGQDDAILKLKLQQKGVKDDAIEDLLKANKENKTNLIRGVKADTSKDLLEKYDALRAGGLEDVSALGRIGEIDGVGGYKNAKDMIEQLQRKKNPGFFDRIGLGNDQPDAISKRINEVENKRMESRTKITGGELDVDNNRLKVTTETTIVPVKITNADSLGANAATSIAKASPAGAVPP